MSSMKGNIEGSSNLDLSENYGDDFVWTEEMMTKLFDHLHYLTAAGVIVEKNMLAASHISIEFHVDVTENNVFNLLKMWRPKHDGYRRLMRTHHKLWNEDTKMFVMSEDKERAYVKANSWAEGLINKPLLHMSDLTPIYYSERPTKPIVMKSKGKSAASPSRKGNKKPRSTSQEIKDNLDKEMAAKFLQYKHNKLALLQQDLFVRERDSDLKILNMVTENMCAEDKEAYDQMKNEVRMKWNMRSSASGGSSNTSNTM